MIISDKKEEKFVITGKLDDVIIEFMSIFDNLYGNCPKEYQITLLNFVKDKATGEFDKEYPLWYLLVEIC